MLAVFTTIDVSHGLILTEKEKLRVLVMKSLFLLLEIAKVQAPSCVSPNKRFMVYLWSCNDQSLRFNDESLVLRIGAGQLTAGQVTWFLYLLGGQIKRIIIAWPRRDKIFHE